MNEDNAGVLRKQPVAPVHLILNLSYHVGIATVRTAVGRKELTQLPSLAAVTLLTLLSLKSPLLVATHEFPCYVKVQANY